MPVGKVIFSTLHKSLEDRNEFEICSVADPDPYVFGPPESGSFYHQAKIVRKNLIPSVSSFDFLSLKMMYT